MRASSATELLLSAHQPVYLPWLGLFHKLAVADRFVIFDDVPYSKKMWYNRNKVLGPNGVIMLSVPVFYSKTDATKHKDVRIDTTSNWAFKHWRSIESAYQKTRYFADYAGVLEKIYGQSWTHLSELNEAMLRQFMVWLGIDTPLVRASDHSFRGEKSSLVLDMSQQLGARAYLFGALGRDYADIGAFLSARIAPLFQDYKHPVYRQNRGEEFVPYLSILDLLFREGAASGDILRSGNPTREDYLAEASRMLEGASVAAG